jgi:ketosteroid isomerase-like protein
MLIEGLVSVLAADTGIQNLLGTTSSRADHTTGIFPVYAPDVVPMPYLTLTQVGSDSLQQSFAGMGAMLQDRWRFSAYATSYK